MSGASRKQNRCVEHAQQIVALCVQENCDQKIKAVCPLELYNDHLDHKFENIAKIHADWGLYEKDARQVEQNISRQAVMKYMDGIIDELLFKIKEHLFLVRKEFQVKLGAYFNSKPVEKIKSSLTGIFKALEQRFLDLRHDEIANAKFFIEVYGMKKLMNDTLSQRQNFEKQILIAFAKIKEEMFMDYPKFNALVKAKQYEYCEIIKNQKVEIDVLKEKLNEISGGYEKIFQEHKQLTYELGRTTNQLKNKQKLLADTTEKLNIVTKKYNEQAAEAITKARQIKTKNILGVYQSQNLYRVSDRIVRTGDKQMDWPNFADVGQATGKIYVRLNRFDVGSWVLMGVMFRHAIEKNQFQFDNYKTLGHGTYLLDSNRWCYSDTDEDFNCKPLGFEYSQNDVIKVQVFPDIIRFSKMAYGWEEEKFQLPYERRNDDEMVFCVAIKGQHTELQLV